MPIHKRRLDLALKEGGFFASVDEAMRAVMAGKVYVNGQKSTKPGSPVVPDDVLSLASESTSSGTTGEPGFVDFCPLTYTLPAITALIASSTEAKKPPSFRAKSKRLL